MANNFQNFQIPQNNLNNIPQNPQTQMNPMTMPNYQQNSILFPQPTGSVYSLNTASDINNIPTGAGLTVGLCLNENVLYIKALHNGTPALLEYKIEPMESLDVNEENAKLKQIIQSYDERFSEIEKQFNKLKEKVGGNRTEWQI